MKGVNESEADHSISRLNQNAEAEFPSLPSVPRSSILVLVAMLLLFLLLRGPVMFRELPGQDEEYFAVPGMTILEEGLPRIPYLPSRDRDSAFYRADEVMFALPPLHFYLQAVVYGVFEPNTGFARFTSTLSGFASIVILYLIGRRWFGCEKAALIGAGLFTSSRVIYFPCVSARPDMMFGFWGLSTLWMMTRWHQERRLKDLILAGGCVGAGFLTHPAALIYAVQSGCWCLLMRGSAKDRIFRASILTLVSLVVFSLWLLLIVQAPDLFWTQFGNNVLNRGGSGLLSRMIMPMEAIPYQGILLLELMQSLQLIIVLLALGSATFLAMWKRSHEYRLWLIVTWGGIYWHLVFQGTHPTKGYWCYTAAPIFLILGELLSRLWPNGGFNRRPQQWRARVIVALVFAGFLPGSGLRTLASHLREWNNPVYDAHQFTEQLIAEYPSGQRYIVDRAYVFAFYRAGREPLLASRNPFYYDVTSEEYDYLIGGPEIAKGDIPSTMNAELMKSRGDCDQPGACCVRVYVPSQDSSQ